MMTNWMLGTKRGLTLWFSSHQQPRTVQYLMILSFQTFYSLKLYCKHTFFFCFSASFNIPLHIFLLYMMIVSCLQGPALYAYNDGLFDEADWKGVRMLSQSVKQNDPLKVGYFGMGFKSVFHLTGKKVRL